MMNADELLLAENNKVLSYLCGNSYRSNRYRLLYVATPKVACTSLKWWFADLEQCGTALREHSSSVETDPELIIHDSFFKVAPHLTGLKPEELAETLASDAYFKFAVVRNPIKRIFSAWQSKILLREPFQATPYIDYSFYNHSIENASDIASAFENFLEHLAVNEAPNYWDVHWTPQATLLRPDLINYSKLVKIENSQELSAALSDWLGSRFVEPFEGRKRANESLIPYLPEFITPRSLELLRLLYSRDFEDFDYSDELPSSSEVFTKEQFDCSIKAIQLIRGRHKRIGEMTEQLSYAEQSLFICDSKISERDERLQDLLNKLQHRDKELQAQYDEIRSMTEHIESLENAMQLMINSHSWKITKPLRWLVALFRNNRA